MKKYWDVSLNALRVKFRDSLKNGARFLPNSLYWRLSPYFVGTAAGRVTRKSASYYLAVWLRHSFHLIKEGFSFDGRRVAEIGPGDSLGLGICSLLAGASSYVALDLVKYSDAPKNLKILREMVELFREDAPIEMEGLLAEADLPACLRPSDVIPRGRLDEYLADGRLEEIRRAIETEGDAGRINITYIAPWDDLSVPPDRTVDLIVSNAVMEHVDDLGSAYKSCSRWLAGGGWMSHEIDFRCHGTANRWNGHWTYSRGQWMQIRGGRPYLLNREPYSTHRDLIAQNGFELATELLIRDYSGITRDRLAEDFSRISDDDLHISLALLQAVRK